MKNHKAACELADQALQEALDKIDELEEDDFRDAKSIIELLKENLTLWKEEEEGGENGEFWAQNLHYIPGDLRPFNRLLNCRWKVIVLLFFLCNISS